MRGIPILEKAVRFISLFLLLAMSVAFIGCGRTSDANNSNQSRQSSAEQAGEAANSNLANQQAAQPTAGDGLTNQPQTSQPPAAGAQTPPPEPPKFERATFIDDVNGGIKDIPYYPGAQLTNVFQSPQMGLNTMTVLMQSSDSLENIQAFYEKAARSKGWKIISKTNNGEQADLMLNKGDKDDAGILVKKDNERKATIIQIVRTEKIPEPKK
jgi:hypothetical protein